MRTGVLSALTASSLVIAPAFAEELGYTVATDVPFGELPRQRLDIYTPNTVSDDTPVLIFLFGGGFISGDKGQVRVIGQNYAAMGTIVIAPNYRIKTTFPDFVVDAAKAVAYVRQHVTNSKGDPRPIVMGGWSSGAYIGAKVAYDGRFLDAEGLPSDTIAGFIGLAGPYWGGLCAGAKCPDTFPPDSFAEWAVAEFVDPGDPPMLLIQGTRDQYVDLGNLETLAAAGEKAGLSVTELILKDKYHKTVMYMLEDAGTEVRDAAEAFIAQATTN